MKKKFYSKRSLKRQAQPKLQHSKILGTPVIYQDIKPDL